MVPIHRSVDDTESNSLRSRSASSFTKFKYDFSNLRKFMKGIERKAVHQIKSKRRELRVKQQGKFNLTSINNLHNSITENNFHQQTSSNQPDESLSNDSTTISTVTVYSFPTLFIMMFFANLLFGLYLLNAISLSIPSSQLNNSILHMGSFIGLCIIFGTLSVVTGRKKAMEIQQQSRKLLD